MLRIRYWRLKRGWTLKELEERCGVDFRLLSEYERGTKEPGSTRLPPIADALGVTVDQLFTRKRKRAAIKEVPCHPLR